MNSAFINSENAGTVMAWCSVLTLAMGLGVTIYQVYNQQKQREEIERAKEAMKALPPITPAEQVNA
jgi:uncharacterized protein HemX